MDDCAIKQLQFDQLQFKEMTEKSPALQQKIDASDYSKASELCRDLFASMFKYTPEINPDVAPDYLANQKVMRELMNLREYENLHEQTKGQAILSASATRKFWGEVEGKLPESVKEHARTTEEIQKRIKNLVERQKAYEELVKDYPELQEELDRQKEAQIEEEAALAGIPAPWTDPDVTDGLRQAIRGALEAAAQDSQQLQDAMDVFGWGDGPGNGGVVAEREIQLLASSLQQSKDLQRLVELAGKFRRIALAKRKQKLRHEPDEIAGIEFGQDLTRMIPAEALYLVDPELEDLFYKKYLSSELMQLELVSKPPEGKGPIIVFSDVSGSMQGIPDIWSKAIGLAMLTIAHREGRDLFVGTFDTSVYQSWEFKKGKSRITDLLNYANSFSGGGTAFAPPLSKALVQIQMSAFKEADLIFITDGVAPLTDDFLKNFNAVRKEKAFNVITVLIGTSSYRAKVEAFSDEVIKIQNLLDDKVVEEILKLH